MIWGKTHYFWNPPHVFLRFPWWFKNRFSRKWRCRENSLKNPIKSFTWTIPGSPIIADNHGWQCDGIWWHLIDISFCLHWYPWYPSHHFHRTWPLFSFSPCPGTVSHVGGRRRAQRRTGMRRESGKLRSPRGIGKAKSPSGLNGPKGPNGNPHGWKSEGTEWQKSSGEKSEKSDGQNGGNYDWKTSHDWKKHDWSKNPEKTGEHVSTSSFHQTSHGTHPHPASHRPSQWVAKNSRSQQGRNGGNLGNTPAVATATKAVEQPPVDPVVALESSLTEIEELLGWKIGFHPCLVGR